MTIIDPHTKQRVMPTPIVIDLAEAERQYMGRLKEEREKERKRVEAAAEKVPQRYALMPGRLLIRARPVETAWDQGGLVAMIEDRVEQMKAHEPWGTILMVGDEFYTDHGQLMKPDKEWVPGRQVMFNPAGATDLELEVPGSETGEMMKLLVVGFRAIVLVDKGSVQNDTTGVDGSPV